MDGISIIKFQKTYPAPFPKLPITKDSCRDIQTLQKFLAKTLKTDTFHSSPFIIINYEQIICIDINANKIDLQTLKDSF